MLISENSNFVQQYINISLNNNPQNRKYNHTIIKNCTQVDTFEKTPNLNVSFGAATNSLEKGASKIFKKGKEIIAELEKQISEFTEKYKNSSEFESEYDKKIFADIIDLSRQTKESPEVVSDYAFKYDKNNAKKFLKYRSEISIPEIADKLAFTKIPDLPLNPHIQLQKFHFDESMKILKESKKDEEIAKFVNSLIDDKELTYSGDAILTLIEYAKQTSPEFISNFALSINPYNNIHFDMDRIGYFKALS